MHRGPDDPADDRKRDARDHVAIDAESRSILSVVPGERTADSVVSDAGDGRPAAQRAEIGSAARRPLS